MQRGNELSERNTAIRIRFWKDSCTKMMTDTGHYIFIGSLLTMGMTMLYLAMQSTGI